MENHEIWVNNRGVRIHSISCNSISDGATPLLICPGLSESAEDYLEFMFSLSPRQCIALSFRGRGKSDAPELGYSLEDHISDLNSVVEHLGLNKFYLFGNSRGVSYALGYALKNLEKLMGLILIDYPACHKKMPEGWAEEYLVSYWGEKLGSELMKANVVRGIEHDSIQVNFWGQIKQIVCPCLIIYGKEQLGSLVSHAQAEQYKRELRNCKLKQCYNSGHGISELDYNTIVNEIKEFLIY